MKSCSKCGVKKSLDEFYKRSSSRDGLHPWCKGCVAFYGKQYHQDKKSDIAGRKKYYYEKVKHHRHTHKELRRRAV